MSSPWHDLQQDMQAKRELVMGAYGRLFGGQGSVADAELVLADLRAFCHVDRDMFSPEAPTLMANLLGRYRVWQRIEGLRRGDVGGFDPQGYAPPETPRRRPLPPASGPLATEG